ncbi:MAG: 2Fe-2S iron-sulfur cluster binding domain-containing protein [Rhodanobacteraceae bacterium]|jgi:ferredoxin-NADP reductase/ferredoxin/truncated hemoglobin YjbI|nr:2Fe-2S iron-sulfur cluster binding domain-containing protein [Rhodanobacteraceae bacterium]
MTRLAQIHYEGRSFVVNPGESVLEALLRQGASVPYSCRKGSCHTCILKREEGDVTHRRAIDPAIERDDHILSCVAVACGDLVLARPEPGHRAIAAEVVERRELGADIVELGIAPLRELVFRAGQHVQLVRDDDLTRPYSIASMPGEDYFFRLHVRRIDGGAMSRWLCDEVRPGQSLGLRGPLGDCCYEPHMRERPLLLLATGSGAGALAAVARQALAEGHVAPIAFHHGVRHTADLYLHAELQQLAHAHANFRYLPCVSRDAPPAGGLAMRVTEALAMHGDLQAAELFLCGTPDMVHEARWRAILAGARRERIHADPFDFAHPPQPRDAEKIAAIAADPELWEALEHGPRLRRILADFYARVYADERLAPFFQGLDQAHVIGKQYEFLTDLMSGSRAYFGLSPYNAHHWMVISDELFDYREALFESVLHEHGLAPPLIRRWMALHERFRAEIVKPAARGIISAGVEQPLRSQSVEYLDIDAVCDGCQQSIPAGQPSRYLYRIGSLHCTTCAGLAVTEEG